MRKDTYGNNPKKCEYCGKALGWEKRNNKFCGHSCSAKQNNVGVRRHGKQPSNCLICFKRLDLSSRKYCSHKCQFEHKYREYVRRWLNKEANGLKGESVSSYVRRYLLEVRGEKCERCGWNERNKFTDKIPLTIHHKDGKWDNNAIDNLEILCPCCHALTSNYGFRNKGNGREYRKKWREKISESGSIG